MLIKPNGKKSILNYEENVSEFQMPFYMILGPFKSALNKFFFKSWQTT